MIFSRLLCIIKDGLFAFSYLPYFVFLSSTKICCVAL